MIVGKDGLGDVEVLLVVNLIPFLVADGQRLHVVAVEHGDDTQHVLVVLVVAHRLRVGIEEGHVLMLQELTAELIDVDGLVIAVHIGIVEGFFRDEVHDVLVFVQPYHCTVHPRLVLCHQCEIGVGIVEEHREQTVAEDEVALDEQRVVFLQFVLHDRERIDVVRLVVDGILGKFDTLNFEL